MPEAATGFSDIIRAIGDFGIMIVVSAAAIFVLVRVLSIMVDQVKTTYESVVPSIHEVKEECNEIKANLLQSLTNHNTASQKNLYELKVDLQTITKHLDQLAQKVDSIESDIKIIKATEERDRKKLLEAKSKEDSASND